MELKAKQRNAYLAGLATGLIGGLVVSLLSSALVAVLVGVIIGGGVTAFLIARSRGEAPMDVAREAVQQAVQPDPGASERPVHEQLCRMNQQVRLGGLGMTLIQPCEELIDLLRDLVPRAQQESAGTETTFDLEQLAKVYLPKLMKEFMDLDTDSRGAREEALIGQLQELHAKVTRIKEFLDQGQIHEFELEHGFLKTKF